MSGLSIFDCAIACEENVHQTLLCPICRELMNQPVSMTCGHSACKACLEDMACQSLNGKKCPLCRETIKNGKLNTNIAVKALIANIGVRCINTGCAWAGKHDEMENHSATCPFKLLKCPNGCTDSHRRGEMDLHLAACPFAKVLCSFCEVGVPRFDLNTHVENCPESPRLCPLQCGEQLPRSHIHLHLSDCPRRMVKCAVKGCNNYYALGAESSHDSEYQESHQVMLKNEVERLRAVLFDKTDENIERNVRKRKSFRWTLKLNDLTEGKDAASPFFCLEGSTFRCIWRRTCTPQRMELDQAIFSKPLTIRVRFALIRDGKVLNTFETRTESIREGNSISTEVVFGHLSGVKDELIIKIMVMVYGHT